jgi:hypothetical protein
VSALPPGRTVSRACPDSSLCVSPPTSGFTSCPASPCPSSIQAGRASGRIALSLSSAGWPHGSVVATRTRRSVGSATIPFATSASKGPSAAIASRPAPLPIGSAGAGRVDVRARDLPQASRPRSAARAGRRVAALFRGGLDWQANGVIEAASRVARSLMPPAQSGRIASPTRGDAAWSRSVPSPGPPPPASSPGRSTDPLTVSVRFGA